MDAEISRLLRNGSAPGRLGPDLRIARRVSEVVNGKRAISKAQVKALGEFFEVSPELFI